MLAREPVCPAPTDTTSHLTAPFTRAGFLAQHADSWSYDTRHRHGSPGRGQWEKHGLRLAKLPGTPSSLEYPRSLALSRGNRTPSRRLRCSRHPWVNRLRKWRSGWRPVRRVTWAFPVRSVSQRHSKPRNSKLVFGVGGCRLKGMTRVLSAESSRPHFPRRWPSLVSTRSASACLLADLMLAVLEPRLGAHPSAVATPILRLALGLLGSPLQGGRQGGSTPSCSVPVACAGYIYLAAPAPRGRLACRKRARSGRWRQSPARLR
jgi:hypothetical protein